MKQFGNPFLHLIFLGMLVPVALLAGELRFSEEGDNWELQVLAESAAGLELEFRLHKLEMQRHAGTTEFRLQNAGEAGLPGYPALPALSRLLICPDGMLPHVEILEKDVERIPVQQLPLRDWSQRDKPGLEKTGPPPAVALPDGYWPQTSARTGDAALWLGRQIAALDLFPLRWDSQEKVLEVSTRLRLAISWRAGGDVPRERGALIHSAAQEILSGLALNPSQLNTADRELEQPPSSGRYLVVAPDAAMGQMAELLRWRRQQGWEIRLLLESELGGLEPDFSTLFDAVQQAFDEQPFDYLLLVGDLDLHPSGTELDYNLEGGFIPGGQYSESEWGGRCGSPYCIASDHLYSLLEGDDYFADVLVGRLSVDTANDMLTVSNRIVSYEREPFLDLGGDWYERALMIYEVAGAMSRRETKLAIRDNLLETGFAEVDTIYTHYWSNPVSPVLISNYVNAGLSLVNYRGYGFRTQWYGPQFRVEEASALQNIGRWPLVTSIVCGGGDFAGVGANDPCFGEAWLRSGSNPTEPAGAIGFIAPSEEDTHTLWNNAIDEGIYEGMTKEGLRSLGSLNDRGKIELWLAYPDARNWSTPAYSVPFYFHTYNLLGDPGTRLRIEQPLALSCELADLLPAGDLALELFPRDENNGLQPGLVACLYHEEQDIALTALCNDHGSVLLQGEDLPAGTWLLTLHGDGLIPFQQEIELQSQASHLELESWVLVEAGGDGLASPGETLGLSVRFLEAGTIGSDTPGTLDLVCLDPRVSSLASPQVLPPSTPGGILEAAAELPFLLNHSFANGEQVLLRLMLDGNLLTTIELEVVNASYQVLSLDSEPALLPGYEGSLSPEIQAGGLATGIVQPRLFSLDAATMILQQDATPVELEAGESAFLSGLSVTISPDVPRGMEIPLLLGFWREGEDPELDHPLCLTPFTLRAGIAADTDPLGPDAFGYMVYHSDDEHELAPHFEWNSIFASGQDLDVEDMASDIWNELPDGITRVVDLPFPFTYCGETWEELTICSNGWVAFGDHLDYYTGLNTPIPAAQGPPAMLAVYWTDLINNVEWDGPFGYLLTEHRPSEGEFIVEWNHFRPIDGPYQVDVQLVLRDPAQWPTSNGNGEILIHYEDVSSQNGENGVTIGLEHPEELSGLEVVFNDLLDPAGQQITDGQSLLIRPMELDTDLNPGLKQPESFALVEIAPNPFNPVTQIHVDLRETGRLELDLFDLRGSLQKSLFNDEQLAGSSVYRLDAAELPSGLYFLRVKSGQNARVYPLTLMK